MHELAFFNEGIYFPNTLEKLNSVISTGVYETNENVELCANMDLLNCSLLIVVSLLFYHTELNCFVSTIINRYFFLQT